MRQGGPRDAAGALRDGVLLSDTTIPMPEGRPMASRAERMRALSDRILDRLEDEVDGGFASELYDLSESLWNVVSAAEMADETTPNDEVDPWWERS